MTGHSSPVLCSRSQINQFHWHVVDSQSFPLEIPGFMDLSQKGAYDSSSVYTPADVADIISYAGAVRTPLAVHVSDAKTEMTAWN